MVIMWARYARIVGVRYSRCVKKTMSTRRGDGDSRFGIIRRDILPTPSRGGRSRDFGHRSRSVAGRDPRLHRLALPARRMRDLVSEGQADIMRDVVDLDFPLVSSCPWALSFNLVG